MLLRAKHFQLLWRNALPFGVLLAVFVGTLSLAIYAEVREQRAQFNSRSAETFNEVKIATDVATGVLASLHSSPSMSMESHLVHASFLSESLLQDFNFVSGSGRFGIVDSQSLPNFQYQLAAQTGSGDIWQYELLPGGDTVAVESAGRAVQMPVIFAANRNLEFHGLNGFDLMSDPRVEKALRISLFGDELVAAPIPTSWNSTGQLLVFRHQSVRSDVQRWGAGYWLVLDFKPLLANSIDAVSANSIYLIPAALETTSEQSQIIPLLSAQPTGLTDNGALANRLHKEFLWSDSFPFGGNTLRLEFRQQAAIGLADWLRGLLLALFVSAIVWTLVQFYRSHRAVIVQQRRQQAVLHLEQQRAAAALASISDAVIILDDDAHVVYANRAGTQLIDRRLRLNFIDQRFAPGQQRTAVTTTQDVDFQVSDVTVSEHCLLRSNGERLAVSNTNSPLYDQFGKPVGNVLVLRDITAESKLKASLEYKANHDALTGIANRLHFNEYFSELFKPVWKTERGHALCYADLDEFKQVNDTCGHAAGDDLLVQLARGLAAVVREIDMVARVGGDEFAIVLVDCDPHAVATVLDRVHRFFLGFDFQYDGHNFPVRASIGYVHFIPSLFAPEEVMAAADSACYAAKRAGRNRVVAGTLQHGSLAVEGKTLHVDSDGAAANNGDVNIGRDRRAG